MLDRLQRAHYRRRFGKERGDLVLEMERSMRALPPGQLSEAWIDWFWSQPPELWEAFMSARQKGERHPDEPAPEEMKPTPPRTLKEASLLGEEVQAVLDEIVAALDANATSIVSTRFDKARKQIEKTVAPTDVDPRRPVNRTRIEQLRHTLPPLPHMSLQERWFDWIASLPNEAHEEALAVTALFATMESVQRVLSETIAIRRTPSVSDQDRRSADERYAALRSWIRACDEEYAELAEPFFARYGRPDLTK